jgi:hypothetical protein
MHIRTRGFCLSGILSALIYFSELISIRPLRGESPMERRNMALRNKDFEEDG